MNHCQEHSLIELIDYRPEWPKVFERLRDDLMPHVSDLTVLESIRRSNHSLYEGLRQERETL
jgi:hypothetical protein